MTHSHSLHIAISGRALSHAYGGVKEYVGATIRELLALDTRHRFSIFYADPKLVGTYPKAQEIYLSAPHKFAWDHLILPRQLRREHPDVVWFPQNVASLGVKMPTVVSIMDMLYFRVPEVRQREYALLDTLYMRAFIPRSLRNASKIMAISDWTARDIVRLIGIQPGKIKTIHLAPSNEFGPRTQEEQDVICAKYNIRRPFFFYAGILSYRKNIRILLDAFGQTHMHFPHDLVITGGSGYIEMPMDDLLEKYGIHKRVRRLGIVPKQDLIALYNAATAFVFPSLYEGFGLPPLEAFACGCPVISSNATSLAEVVGNAALTFAPHDVDALAQHLKSVAVDESLRRKLTSAGFEQVKHFSYIRAARELVDVLEEAAE